MFHVEHFSKSFFGIEEDGDGTVIHEFHVHHRLKSASFAAEAGDADLFHKVFV
jgi:hypothetical protein